MEFAKPWLDEARNDEQRKTVVGMGVLAWNMALSPEPERWEGLSPGFEQELGKPGRAILEEMIARKLALYPQEPRPILDYEITGEGENMRIDVAYSLLPQEIADLKQSDQGFRAD